MRKIGQLVWSGILIIGIIWGFQNRATLGPQVAATVAHYQVKLAAALSGQLGSQLMATDDAAPATKTKQQSSSTAASSTSTVRSTVTSSKSTPPSTTPVESIVQNAKLSKHYYYQFDTDLSAPGRQVFKDAVAIYNQTGIVKLVAGKAPKGQNQITFGVYHKRMANFSASIELGHGGPKIIERISWYGSEYQNRATASLNGAYTRSYSDAVAVHELGHALGLDHSAYKSSVMYPVSQGKTNLSRADLASLNSIYKNS